MINPQGAGAGKGGGKALGNAGAGSMQYSPTNAAPYARNPLPGASQNAITNMTAPSEDWLTGTIATTGKFGFIEQDSDEEKMICIPGSCAALGNIMPPIGTRVQYKVFMDPKTRSREPMMCNSCSTSTSTSSNGEISAKILLILCYKHLCK